MRGNARPIATTPLPRGFTITELLAVIAIIGVLVGLVLVSMRGLRQAGLQTRQLSDLRQIVAAHRAYGDDNDARLLPGYIGEDLMAADKPFANLKVHSPDGMEIDVPKDKQSYVWRLAPYLGQSWRFLFTAAGESDASAQLDQEYGEQVYGPGSAGPNDIGISEHPAFGLNSVFLGGDSIHGGAWAIARNPWDPTATDEPPILAATRMAQVKNPAKCIAFAPTARASESTLLEPDGDLEIAHDETSFGTSGIAKSQVGFAYLSPPYTHLDVDTDRWLDGDSRWWRTTTGGDVQRLDGAQYTDPGVGLPICRSKPAYLPVAMIDGSTVVEYLPEISRDMTRWSPFEVARRLTLPEGDDTAP
jgi:prepilin-type N-terminal cleavage/methylation domain-containing protein